ncbi:hypothetical protein N7494_001474 [Penicillium frequentans]|uniref:Uncharacterized protein n=1 Tax=Penicillium frequentans TaxID=3151616 RepID=A0AAD6D2X4_9EURO|nr:hypothetical protein N7494_001474 [Penicillium glabrum]
MAYSQFRQLHDEVIINHLDPYAGHEPALYDKDGAPLYEDHERSLLGAILYQNDVASLRLYNDSPHTKIFHDLNAYFLWDDHPFIAAGSCGSFDALHALLDFYVADPTLPEPLEQYLARIPISLMNLACQGADLGIVQRLLNYDPPLATLHNRQSDGETPLLSAARAMRIVEDDGHIGAVAIRRKNRDRLTRLEEMILFLLGQGCSVKDSNIYHDIASNIEGSNQPPPLAEPELAETVLSAAIAHASYQLVSRLIVKGADVYARQQCWDPSWAIEERGPTTALHIASISWNLEGMQALIDHTGERTLADMVMIVDGAGRTPLHWALCGYRDDRSMDTRGDQQEITAHMVRAVERLLDANPGLVNVRDKDGATVFHYAVASDAGLDSVIPVAQLLFRANPLPDIVNARDHTGTTALQIAVDHQARRGCTPDRQLLDLLEIFLGYGADGSVCNNKGQNLVHTLAMDFENTDPAEVVILERLLQFVHIQDTDSYGRTPLHYVARYSNRINIVRSLVRQGANVNAADNKGNTPLHEVMRVKPEKWRSITKDYEDIRSDLVARKRDQMIQVLMDAGAMMDQRNAAGKTPSQILDERTRKIEQRWQEMIARGDSI